MGFIEVTGKGNCTRVSTRIAQLTPHDEINWLYMYGWLFSSMKEGNVGVLHYEEKNENKRYKVN